VGAGASLCLAKNNRAQAMAPRVAERANCAPGCAAVTLFLVAHFEHKAARCVIFVAFVNYERFCFLNN
jgi:hypothetical protein